MLFWLGLLLAVVAVALLGLANRRRKESGLPYGRLIASDTGAWGPVSDPLYNRELGLTGKPDYLVESGSDLIPVEVKSSRAPSAPYDAHIFQLAAYCLLVESHFGRRPPYGILRYADHTFAIDYTNELEAALLELIEEMRNDERRRSVNRSHDQQGRCIRCGYRSTCDQHL